MIDALIDTMTAASRPLLDREAVEQARLVSVARAQLLERSKVVTTSMLATGRGVAEDACRQWVSRQRRAGRLITVSHQGGVLIPTFQLDDAFDLRPDIADVTARLVAFGLDGWAAWDWWETPNGWLDGVAPAKAVSRGDHEAVRRAVQGLIQD